MFEIIKSDLAGRIATLHTNHGDIETPAYVPVISPVKQTISTNKIREMGFNLVITNAYITMLHYRDDAIKYGIHKLIDFDGAIMTDSGGYQVLEYGNINVSPDDIAKFEVGIGSDIAVPLDKPTGYGLSKEKAKSFVKYTLKISKKALLENKSHDQIWVGPIQGSEHLDLVKYATKYLVKCGFMMLALGSPVELMKSYEYKLLTNMIMSSKRHIPSSIPLHLFGAGHPLTIPLAVALGCDTFDSASYILYAKRNRYMSEDRTRNLDDMKYFSCSCEVCMKFTPNELRSLKKEERINKVALHNLFSIKSEINRVKEAIYEGRLWEYVIKKARSHPKLFEIISILTSDVDYFIKTTPRFKPKSIFLFSYEDQFRPEVISYHNIVKKFKTRKRTLLIINDTNIKPLYLSREYNYLKKKFPDSDSIQFCQYNPFLGIIPLEISDMYPASHYEMVRTTYDPTQFPIFDICWINFFKKNNFDTIYIDKNDNFIKFFAKKLPRNITKKFYENNKK